MRASAFCVTTSTSALISHHGPALFFNFIFKCVCVSVHACRSRSGGSVVQFSRAASDGGRRSLRWYDSHGRRPLWNRPCLRCGKFLSQRRYPRSAWLPDRLRFFQPRRQVSLLFFSMRCTHVTLQLFARNALIFCERHFISASSIGMLLFLVIYLSEKHM